VFHPYIDANELQQFFSKCFSVLLWIEGVIYKTSEDCLKYGYVPRKQPSCMTG